MNRMKKLFILLISAFMMSISAYAWNRIPLTVGYEKDDMPSGNGYPKSPMRPPVVYIEYCILCYDTSHTPLNPLRRL